jgi:putative ABC transport system substrate-binding protein
MKKNKMIGLVSLVMAGAISLVGCGSNIKHVGNDSGDNLYTIGINQLAEHPALDDARKGFEDGLKELGVNAKVVYQNAQGDIPNSLIIAQKFVKDEVDLIYAIATPAVQSTKQATLDIPILFSAVTDPVKSEIVDDWEDVGGNITGTSDLADTASQLKMFKEIDRNIKTIGILYNTGESNSAIQIEEVEKLAPSEGLNVITVGVSSVNEIPQAIDSLLNKVDAMYNLSDSMIAGAVELVSTKLIEGNTISVSTEETQVNGGLLVTNGLSYYDLGKQTAVMAKEILVDKKDISTIPVGLAEKTVTTVNEKTLELLGLDSNLPLFKDAIKVGK